MKGFLHSYGPVLLAVWLWGIHGPAGRYLALEGVSMPFVTVTRFWIGTLFLLIYLLLSGNFSKSFFSFWREILPIALIGIALNSIVYHLGFRYVSATVAMLLENSGPFFVLILARFIERDQITRRHLISAGISCCGLLFIMLGRGGARVEEQSLFWIGVVLELIAGATFGAYTWMSGGFLTRHRETFKGLGLSNTQVVINLLFQVFWMSATAMSPLYFLPTQLPSTRYHWFWIIEMGIFQSGVAYILWLTSIDRIRSGVTSLFFFMTLDSPENIIKLMSGMSGTYV